MSSQNMMDFLWFSITLFLIVTLCHSVRDGLSVKLSIKTYKGDFLVKSIIFKKEIPRLCSCAVKCFSVLNPSLGDCVTF